MLNVITQVQTEHTPESLAESLQGEPGLVLLRSALHDAHQGRYSIVAARPFLTFTSSGTRCEIRMASRTQLQFGNPWSILDALLARYEILDEVDVPFPLGGCFGYWGYELKDALESCLTRRAVNDLELPDCHLGFHDSLVVFDHVLGTTHLISTGLQADGSRSMEQARAQFGRWKAHLHGHVAGIAPSPGPRTDRQQVRATLTRRQFIDRVRQAKAFIRSGDIYQVNLARRLSIETGLPPWSFFQRLQAVSPSPFAAFLNCGRFQIASSSPESFLRLSGRAIRTRPIKGTRPRGGDPEQDTRLAYELQTSAKEQAELVMITDLLRNDLGRVCEFGSVNVPDLFRLERFSHVQHLVSTVDGQLRPGITHSEALSACFPGGSITGAPKIRAMQIINGLEKNKRNAYAGAVGYFGWDGAHDSCIALRTCLLKDGKVYVQAGAGVVADSDPTYEYNETVNKAMGMLRAIGLARTLEDS